MFVVDVSKNMRIKVVIYLRKLGKYPEVLLTY